MPQLSQVVAFVFLIAFGLVQSGISRTSSLIATTTFNNANIKNIISNSTVSSTTPTMVNRFCDPIDLSAWYQQLQTEIGKYNTNCLQFVKLFKLEGTKEALIFASIYNFDNEKKKLMPNFKFLNQMAETNVHYRLVIHFEQGNNHFGLNRFDFEVTFNKVSYKIEFRDGLTEYMIPELFKWDSNNYELPKFSITKKTQLDISKSYIMACASFFKNNSLNSKATCSFAIHRTQVQCYCISDNQGYELPLSVIILLCIILIVLIGNYWLSSSEKEANPEVQFCMVLCMPGQSTHEYLIIFRVGPATDGFDYQTSHIDIQLLTVNNEPLGVPVRYAAANLADPMCSEMHMLACSILPLSHITAIRANHSAPGNLLRLYDFYVVDLRANHAIVQEETIQQYITSEPSILLPQSVEMAKLTIKSSVFKSPLPISMVRLTKIEIIAIIVFVLGLTSFLVMLARVHLHVYAYWKNMAHSVKQFAMCFTTVCFINLLLIALIEALYLLYIKKHYLNERQLEITSETTLYCWQLVCNAYLLTLYIFGFALLALTVHLSKPLDLQSGFFWSGINCCVIALSIGAWLVIDEYVLACIKTRQLAKEYVASPLPNHSNPKTYGRYSAFQTLAPTATSDRSAPYSSVPLSTATNQALSTFSNFGPKLLNPKWNAQSVANQTAQQIKSVCPAYSQFMKSHKSGNRQRAYVHKKKPKTNQVASFNHQKKSKKSVSPLVLNFKNHQPTQYNSQSQLHQIISQGSKQQFALHQPKARKKVSRSKTKMSHQKH